MDLFVMVTFLTLALLRIITWITGSVYVFYLTLDLTTFNLLVCFLRITDFFRIERNLGPLIIMIGKMLKETTAFLLIIALFGLSFSLAFILVSIEIPAEAKENLDVPFYLQGLWAIFGQIDLQFLPKYRSFLGTSLLIFYLFIAQILLLNVLVAIFGDAYTETKENAGLEWRFARLSIISEWKSRSVIPPPLNLLGFLLPSKLRNLKRSQFILHTDKRGEQYLEENRSKARFAAKFARRLLLSEESKTSLLEDLSEKVNVLEEKMNQTLQKLDLLSSKLHLH